MNLKRYFTISFILGVYVTNSYSAGNPAAIYCERMGYEYVIETNSEGKSVGMCKLPDGSKVNAWDFFKGKVKPEYSYCKKAGYDIVSEEEIQGSYTTQTAYCVKGTTLRSGSSEQKVAMVDLMKKNGLDMFKFTAIEEDVEVPLNPGYVYAPGKPTDTYPDIFDSRNDGYVNDVKDQGDLGSCWAFAAAGMVETCFNKLYEFKGDDRLELSESFIIYCLAGNPEINMPIYHANCIKNDSISDGGDPKDALNEINKNGVCINRFGIHDEERFKYRTTPPDACTHWNDPKIFCPKGTQTHIYDKDEIKRLIYRDGIVDINIYTKENFHDYINGIYDLAEDQSDTTGSHAVCLVGWGVEDNTEYWILRNSWGSTWGENGYMKLKMHTDESSNFQCLVHFASYYDYGFIWEQDHIEMNHIVPECQFKNFTLKGAKILLKDGFHAEKNSGFRAIATEPIIKDPTEVLIPCAEDDSKVWESTKSHSYNGSSQITEVIDLTDNSTITLYPNPSTGQFTVEFGDAVGEKQLRVYTMNGDLVYESTFYGEKAEIALNGATAGIYVVQVVTADDAMTQQLIIK